VAGERERRAIGARGALKVVEGGRAGPHATGPATQPGTRFVVAELAAASLFVNVAAAAAALLAMALVDRALAGGPDPTRWTLAAGLGIFAIFWAALRIVRARIAAHLGRRLLARVAPGDTGAVQGFFDGRTPSALADVTFALPCAAVLCLFSLPLAALAGVSLALLALAAIVLRRGGIGPGPVSNLPGLAVLCGGAFLAAAGDASAGMLVAGYLLTDQAARPVAGTVGALPRLRALRGALRRAPAAAGNRAPGAPSAARAS